MVVAVVVTAFFNGGSCNKYKSTIVKVVVEVVVVALWWLWWLWWLCWRSW